MMIDSTLSYITTLAHVDSRVILFNFDVFDGSLIGSMYASDISVTCTNALKMVEISGKLYLTIYCGTYYVEVYDIAGDTFVGTYKTVNSNVHFTGFIVNNGFGYYIGYWYPAGASGYVHKVHDNNLDAGPHVEDNLSTLFASTAAYPIVSDVVTSKFYHLIE